MAHPFHEHRQHKVEHSRVGHITRGYASGGGVGHSDEKQDRKLFKKLMKEEDSQEVEGGSAKERMDRPGRAGKKKGGAVKAKKRAEARGFARGGAPTGDFGLYGDPYQGDWEPAGKHLHYLERSKGR